MARLKSSVNRQKKSVLNRVINFFVQSNYRAYLVGGYVRDSTLGRRCVDIDVVVEDDAIKVAKELDSKLKGKLNIYKEFRTASIITDNLRIDLASARKEKYPSPARLPRVYPSTIVEDLNRRDFTINAIAMSISRENFGEIFDPFNGLQDIKRGIIRVLHNRSFIDDPTRVFRALRYKNRFGFRIDKMTLNLMKQAIQNNIIKCLTGKRILNEIRLIFSEETYYKTLEDCSKFDIFKIKERELQVLSIIGPQGLYLFLSKINSKGFPLSNIERKLVEDFKGVDRTIQRLKKAKKNSTIYHILSPISVPVVNTISTIQPKLKEKIKIYSRLKKIKPFICGNDLKKIGFKPDKKFKLILKRMFDLQIDKIIKSKKEAIKYLKNGK